MIREVDLVSYLPAYMKEYDESVAALKAENKEFYLIWTATDRCLHNRFISTADEYGISRFEQMLGISPSVTDDLETRRIRVYNRWNIAIPYTMRTLLKRLISLLGEKEFTIRGKFSDSYELTVTVYTDCPQIDELEYTLSEMVPMNIVTNVIYENALTGNFYMGGIISEASILELKQR